MKGTWAAGVATFMVAAPTASWAQSTGFGLDFGAGLRLSLSRAISVSPEIRWLDAPWMSGANLAVTRVVLRTAYSW